MSLHWAERGTKCSFCDAEAKWTASMMEDPHQTHYCSSDATRAFCATNEAKKRTVIEGQNS